MEDFMKDKPVPVNLETVDMKRLEDLSADLPGLMEYAHSKGGFAIQPTQSGVIKGKAKQAMMQQTGMQLDLLYEQVKLIAGQVKTIKERATVSEIIYEAEIKFEPVIGESYHLYKNHL